jgi:hypothetical protein
MGVEGHKQTQVIASSQEEIHNQANWQTPIVVFSFVP